MHDSSIALGTSIRWTGSTERRLCVVASFHLAAIPFTSLHGLENGFWEGGADQDFSLPDPSFRLTR